MDFAEYLDSINQSYCSDVPPMTDTQEFVDDLVHLLFPIKTNKNISRFEIEIQLERMQLRLKQLMLPLQKDLKKTPKEIAKIFFDKMPVTFKALLQDADAFIKSDPASKCVEEVILCYPGYYALTVHRLAHILYLEEVPVLPRIMSEHAHSKTGIDIHPGAKIGNNFFIDHGTGIVIGETAEVGNNVKIYQGVTLGAMYVQKKMKETKRHPTIEDNVIIYAGSTILGGKTVIGHDTVVGGNVWVTESVMPHSVVYRQHKSVVRDSKKFKEPINFII
ncbi:MAG: serine O-acetyltransferase EpsC [Bacteroidales bacterium]